MKYIIVFTILISTLKIGVDIKIFETLKYGGSLLFLLSLLQSVQFQGGRELQNRFSLHELGIVKQKYDKSFCQGEKNYQSNCVFPLYKFWIQEKFETYKIQIIVIGKWRFFGFYKLKQSGYLLGTQKKKKQKKNKNK
eukprot:TRINITY_DN1659_c0_g1_i3.p5 TRINITY_DN1659_c0_g1~~TRINITY_DN1659_c0_g1_i3.p5  ORF type:complete len:137 (+),score=2.14 TRINITY_DN1659_c0_g1_i3:1380-1790(+)